MAEKVENPVRENVLVSDVKCRAPLSGLTSAPRALNENSSSNRTQSGKEVGGDIEQLEKKRTRRRRKAKRKNPYNKNNPEVRGKKAMRGKNGYEQPVAPYNSNQFLIEDHNDLKDFDVKLLAVAQASKTENLAVDGVPRRTGRVRDPSFTSADSEDDYFYSSPEDEEEFLTKEFSNTYQDLHAEDLASMSKSELIQQVLQLEEKCDALEKRLSEEKKFETARSDSESAGSGVEDKMLVYQREISKLTHVNEELKNENLKLKQHSCGSGKCGTESSEDSESDSSSSSDSSEMSEGEEDASGQPSPPENPYKHMNGHLDSDIGHMETDNVT